MLPHAVLAVTDRPQLGGSALGSLPARCMLLKSNVSQKMQSEVVLELTRCIVAKMINGR